MFCELGCLPFVYFPVALSSHKFPLAYKNDWFHPLYGEASLVLQNKLQNLSKV